MSRPTPPAPDGMRWCSRCKKLQPVSEFTPKDFYCKTSRKAYELGRQAAIKKARKARPYTEPKPPPPKPVPVIAPPPKPVPPPATSKKGWRGLPPNQVVEREALALKGRADAVPAGQPWTREATQHEVAMLAHGAQVVSQIRAAHFALDVITSGWALMREAAE